MIRLEARDLSYAVNGLELVAGVDLEVHSGEVVAVVGPNGSGKTTLLRLMSGELEPASGSVEIAGRDLAATQPGELARERAVLPQHNLLQFAFRCLEVVMMGRYPHAGGEDEDLAVVERVMAEADVGHLRARLYPTLSGGEQTRVSLARVLAQETPLILLDEPTGSLDLRHQELVMATLKGLAAAGAAVLAVLHDMNLAARHADRIVLLEAGAVRASGSPAVVLEAEVIESVYGHPVQVLSHPELGCPLILPRRA